MNEDGGGRQPRPEGVWLLVFTAFMPMPKCTVETALMGRVGRRGIADVHRLAC